MQNGEKGEECKNSDARKDLESNQNNRNEFMPILEDESEKQTDAENLKKALDSFTSKLSADAVETVEVSSTNASIKHEVIDVMEKEQSVASASTMHEVAGNSNDAAMDTDAEAHRCEGSNPNESTEEDDSSEPESETHGDADSNVGQNIPKSSPMRSSQGFASMQNASKSKPKPMQSKQNSYPNLQHQPFPNFASGYGFDPERLLFGNYPQNPFLNPNFAAMLDPKQLLANLSSSLTTANQKAASQIQPQRPRKPTLVRKPLKLAPKKPLKRDYSQWQSRMVTQSSANNQSASSSSSQSQQYNLLRSILTQPTPKQSKPSTVTSSSCSSANAYSIQEFASNQYQNCNRVSWSDAGAAMAHNNHQHSIQKPRPKASSASTKVKRSTQYTCSVCSRQFIYFKAYQEHLNSHISAIHCPGCTKTFASRGFLERHLDSGKCSLKKK
jgi:DNA-directed RNA polymerase subunit RPC12/RpoP